MIEQPNFVSSHTWSALYPGVLLNAEDFTWVETDLEHVHAIIQTAVPLAAHRHGPGKTKMLYGARIRFCGWHEWDHTRRRSYYMMTSGQLVSMLPGKVEVGEAGLVAAIFTWGGRTTSRFGLGEKQAFELLCFQDYSPVDYSPVGVGWPESIKCV